MRCNPLALCLSTNELVIIVLFGVGSMRIKAAKFAAWFSAASVVVCLAGCWTTPGKGAKATAGYCAAAPVIAALERFHAERGDYPASLGELVPRYLPDQRTLLVRGRVQPVNAPGHDASIPEQEFGYQRDGDKYTLLFGYTGPGINTCAYDSQTKTWHAAGHY